MGGVGRRCEVEYDYDIDTRECVEEWVVGVIWNGRWRSWIEYLEGVNVMHLTCIEHIIVSSKHFSMVYSASCNASTLVE